MSQLQTEVKLVFINNSQQSTTNFHFSQLPKRAILLLQLLWVSTPELLQAASGVKTKTSARTHAVHISTPDCRRLALQTREFQLGPVCGSIAVTLD